MHGAAGPGRIGPRQPAFGSQEVQALAELERLAYLDAASLQLRTRRMAPHEGIGGDRGSEARGNCSAACRDVRHAVQDSPCQEPAPGSRFSHKTLRILPPRSHLL